MTVTRGRHVAQLNPQAEAKKLEDAAAYLSLPSTKAELEEKGHAATGRGLQSLGSCTISRDSFQVSTLVCSTKLTQNGEWGRAASQLSSVVGRVGAVDWGRGRHPRTLKATRILSDAFTLGRKRWICFFEAFWPRGGGSLSRSGVRAKRRGGTLTPCRPSGPRTSFSSSGRWAPTPFPAPREWGQAPGMTGARPRAASAWSHVAP